MILTSSTLISQVQNLAALSQNSAALSNDQLLLELTMQLEWLVGEVTKLQENFLTYRDEIPVVAGQSAYPVPYRSAGNTIDHLYWQNQGGGRKALTRAALKDLEYWNAATTGVPIEFYMTGNRINLLPTPSESGTLVVWYPFAPSQLVIGSAAPPITAVNYATSIVTVGSLPASFITGMSYDIVDHRPINGIVYYDLAGTVAGNDVIFSQPIPNVRVGNYLGLAQTAPVPMVPDELHRYLVELAVARIAEQRGSVEEVKIANLTVDKIAKKIGAKYGARVKSKPKVYGGRPSFRNWGGGYR